MKKLFLVLTLLLSIITCTSCKDTNEVTTSDDSVTITIAKPTDLIGINNLISQFESLEKNIRVKVVDVPSPLVDSHRIYVSAFTGNDKSIDLYAINNQWTSEFASKKYISPIDTMVSIDKKQYVDNSINQFTYDSKLFALPIMLDMNFLYYRKDLVQVPQGATWNDVQEISNNKSTDTTHGIYFCEEINQDLVSEVLNSENISDEKLKSVILKYKSIYSSTPIEELQKSNMYLASFKAGNALFMYGSSILWNSINDDLSMVKGKVGVARLNKDNPSIYNIISGYGIAINANSAYKEQAAKFLSFLSTDIAQRTLAKEFGYLPVVKELYSDEMVIDYSPHYKNIFKFIQTSDMNIKSTNFVGVSTKITDDFVRYLKNEINIDEAVNSIIEAKKQLN